MLKAERAQRERHMSQYEQRRRGNALSGDVKRLPNEGNTRVGQRGSGHLAAFSVCLALQLPFPQVSESMGNHDSKIVDAGSVN